MNLLVPGIVYLQRYLGTRGPGRGVKRNTGEMGTEEHVSGSCQAEGLPQPGWAVRPCVQLLSCRHL